MQTFQNIESRISKITNCSEEMNVAEQCSNIPTTDSCIEYSIKSLTSKDLLKYIRAMEVRCSLVIERARKHVALFRRPKSLETTADKLHVFLMKIFMSHNIRGAGINLVAVRL